MVLVGVFEIRRHEVYAAEVNPYLMQKTCRRDEKDGTLLEMFHTQWGCCPLFAVAQKMDDNPRGHMLTMIFLGSKCPKSKGFFDLDFFGQFHIWTMHW